MADDQAAPSAPTVPRAGMDVKAMIGKLQAFDFKVVADLFNLVNNDPEKETELVDLFARYYEKVSHSQQFLCWAIEWEVERTEHPSTLFRLESVATGLLFRHFFSDDGMYCLETSVCPLIERVSLDVASGKGDLSKDVDYILKETRKFLIELEHSCSLFPLDIREAFRTLHARVHERFPDTKNALAVILFLRFLCPTILQPASFGITEEPLTPDVVKTLLPIARLLQCIANETVENKIFDGHNDKVMGFIKDNIDTVRQFCMHLTNEQEIAAIKKMTKMAEFRPDEKDIALQNIMEYISGPEFPMPSLEVSSSARQLPALVKKRKIYSLDDRSTRLEMVLDYVKINVVFLFVDLEHPSYITMMDETAKIRAEMDKLGVKQIVLAGGTTKTANLWFENTKFKGDVYVDTSGKMQQLFAIQKRKSTRANLFSGKMAKLRKKFAVSSDSTDGLAWAATQASASGTPTGSSPSASNHLAASSSSEGLPGNRASLMERRMSLNNAASIQKFKAMQKDKEEKTQKERDKEEKKKEEKEKAEPKLVKMFVLFGDRISFESKYEGQPQDLLNLLQACGARPEVIETARKRLKKRKKISFFTLRRNSVKVFSSSLKEAKEKDKDKDKDKNKSTDSSD
jgi:hypothetical protein